MNFDEYQEGTASTAIYPKDIGLSYVALGLAGECGEICNKIKKIYRDDEGVLTRETAGVIANEAQDVLWYISQLATELGFSLGDIAQANLDKLQSRKERGVLKGSGDDR